MSSNRKENILKAEIQMNTVLNPEMNIFPEDRNSIEQHLSFFNDTTQIDSTLSDNET
ncbi:hypothetical protein JOD45_001233 [Scopulibacillus daqui]|uniref:Uncharacterized protein n=1 Tax=Scopulibacillus daqui TaxID=1469162 RepID=A0ABS2PYA1_9BACL|nr:hypothetical protein [Scopulibacillus daqui]MBM7645024.1 hypothetical protein [Scopulibacillus daqui]